MNSIVGQENFNELSSKYGVTSFLRDNGGYGLLKKYKGSTSKLLVTLHPEYKKNCRDIVMSVVRDMKLSKVEDILYVPQEYPL